MTAHDWVGRDMTVPESVPFGGGQVLVYSRACPGRESVNEDAAAVIELSPDRGLFVVSDGVGGGNAGDRAAQRTIETLVALSADQPSGSGLRGAVLDAIEAANREIIGWGIGAGATVAVVAWEQGELRSFHVGDSTVLLCSNRGRLKYATVGHGPVEMAIESGWLDEAEGLQHEDRHLIDNCLGTPEMKIEIGPPLKMALRDTLVVGSDGLFDNLTRREIIDCVCRGPLETQALQLTTMAIERMADPTQTPSKPDDLTLICFRRGS